MSDPKLPLEAGNFYHIYNRGIDGCDLFRCNSDYERFLLLYDKYIPLIADTYAWVLMKNHFHLLVKIKEENEIGFIYSQSSSGSPTYLQKPLLGFSTTQRVLPQTPSADEDPEGGLRFSSPFTNKNPEGGFKKKYHPSHQFSHLFNAYAQSLNKRNERTGSLFEHPFHRKLITDEYYLRQVILYIHHNPVHHKFCEHPCDYPWSSYLSCISLNPSKIKRDAVIGWFDDEANFKYMHEQKVAIDAIHNWLGL